MLALVLVSMVAIIEGCGGDGVTTGSGGAGTPNAGSSVKRIFLSSTAHTGSLGGLSGADAICLARATAAGLGGTWKVWLSDNTANAISRINDVGPWYLVDRSTLIFQNRAAMVSSNPATQISKDENGNSMGAGPPGVLTWTGTMADGTKAASNCSNWMSALGATQGDVGANGNNVNTNSYWTSGGTVACNGARNLICIEQ